MNSNDQELEHTGGNTMKQLQELEESNASSAEIEAAIAEFDRQYAEQGKRFDAFCRQHGLPTDECAEQLLLQVLCEEERRQEVCDGMQAIVNDYEKLMGFYDRYTMGDAA